MCLENERAHCSHIPLLDGDKDNFNGIIIKPGHYGELTTDQFQQRLQRLAAAVREKEPPLVPARPQFKKKSKKCKLNPSATPPKKMKKKRNYSIKPPPTSSRRGKTKTGFNSKSLLFEPVQSPSEYLNKKPQPPVLDWRHSIAVVEDLTNDRITPSSTSVSTAGPMSSHTPTPTPTPPPHSHILERKFSLQVTGIGEGQSLVDAMSARNSPGLNEMAMSKYSNPWFRYVSDSGQDQPTSWRNGDQ